MRDIRRIISGKKALRDRSEIAEPMDDTTLESLADCIMEEQKKENTVLPVLKKQLREVQKGIENMLNAIQMGIITPSTKERLEELEREKSYLFLVYGMI